MTRLTRFAPRPTLLFALLSLALAVRAGTAAAKPKPRLEAAAGKLEVDAKKLARSKILRRGDFRKLGSAKVRLGTGPAVSLGTIARRVFADQRALARGLRQAKGVQGKVRVVETAIERKDAYELTLSTTAVVSDPDKVTKKVPRLARWKVASRRSPSQLEPKQRKAFDQWVRGDLKRLPASHPLRRAYDRGGEKALVAAMVAGKGTYTFEQTLIVPRAMPSLRAAKLKPPRKPKRLKPKRIQRRRIKRSVDPMQDELRRLIVGDPPPDFDSSILGGEDEASPAALPILLGQVRKSGVTGGSVKMLTGFTEGDEWIFRERFGNDYGSFYGRVTAWAAVGLRFPLRFKHRMTPSKIRWSGPVDVDVPFDVTLRADTFDGSPADYRALGVDEDEVLEGKELVLEAGVEARVIVKVFGRKVLDEKWSEKYDYGRDFAPALGRQSVELTRFFIPASLTNTDFRFGPAHGSMQLGAKIDARGSVGAKLRLKSGGSTVPSWRPGSDRKRATHSLRFSSTASKHERRAKVRKCTRSCTKKYGFEIRSPSYRATLSMTPVVRLEATADLWITSLSYEDDFWMPELSFDLTRRTFGAHEGTRSSSRQLRGDKRFSQRSGM